MEKGTKHRVYLASGWFNETQERELTRLEQIFYDRAEDFELYSPRKIFVCKPDASIETQNEVFQGNLIHIEKSTFVLVNTRDKDIGTIWEAGYAYAKNKKIVYFCAGLPEGAKFNLMLARSGIKVCTSFEQLEEYLDKCTNDKILHEEPYMQSIE